MVECSPAQLTLQVVADRAAGARLSNSPDDATGDFTSKTQQYEQWLVATDEANAVARNVAISISAGAANSSITPQRSAAALVKCDSAARPRSRGAPARCTTDAAVSELQSRKPSRRKFG